MSNFGIIFIDFSLVFFSVMVYLIYEVYTENINKKKNDLVLSFCLFSSLYLIFRFGILYGGYCVIFESLLLIFYLKKDWISGLFVSIIVLLYLFFSFGVSLNFFLFLFKYSGYLLLFFLYGYRRKKYIICNVLFGFIFLIITVFMNNLYDAFIYLFYFFVTYFIVLFLINAEKIVEINVCYKELLKENQLRESLFKISHEIKNPIAVCKGYLDMFDINNMSHFKRYIPIIKSEINKTLNLLQDFSAFSKIKVECDIMDISLLLDDIMDNFKLMFDDRNIDFSIETVDDEFYINGDYNRLNQVLLNIIKNSIEAIDNSKTKSFIKIYTEVDDKNIRIIISDNGVGISSDIIDKIGEPFYTTKQNGTGLGVLLSNEIICAHNGSLEYKSVLGEGTTVIITLPLYIY